MIINKINKIINKIQYNKNFIVSFLAIIRITNKNNLNFFSSRGEGLKK